MKSGCPDRREKSGVEISGAQVQPATLYSPIFQILSHFSLFHLFSTLFPIFSLPVFLVEATRLFVTSLPVLLWTRHLHTQDTETNAANVNSLISCKRICFLCSRFLRIFQSQDAYTPRSEGPISAKSHRKESLNNSSKKDPRIFP